MIRPNRAFFHRAIFRPSLYSGNNRRSFNEVGPPPLFLLTRLVHLGVSFYEVSLPRNFFVYSEGSPTSHSSGHKLPNNILDRK